MFASNVRSFVVGWLLGGGLAIAGWAWSVETSTRDSVRLNGSGGATFMGVAGELPACSAIQVEPPRVVADFGSPAGLDKIELFVDSCAGAVPSEGGHWLFDSSDSWKYRKPLKIAESISGGRFECSTVWKMSGFGSGPVDFIAEWRIVKLQEDRCNLMSEL